MIRVFIGYDYKEAVAFNVLAHSILINASQPVSITPVMLSQLKNYYSRSRHELQSTEFSFSRFLVPLLCDYQGQAIFMDCDMLVRGDIADLWQCFDDNYAVQVVKHHHEPANERKFLDQPQSRYEKKNWSSVMIFNNPLCKELTQEYVNTASGLELHQFKWLESESLIGDIPHQWNVLVDYDEHDEEAKLVHYTEGGPYFSDYADCDYAIDWHIAKEKMLHTDRPI